MTRQSNRPDDGRGAWRTFAARHKNSPFLILNPLYALPEPLLEIVTREVSGLLKAGEASFERDLARTTAAGGFFHRRPFYCPLTPPPPTPAEKQLQEKLDAVRAEAMKDDGRSDLQIKHHFAAEEKRQQEVALRSVAYTAWLVTNSTFIEEVHSLRPTWEGRVAAARRFPAQRHTFLGERSGPTNVEEARLLAFYRRWGLETFATWDLPVPMAPQFFAITYADTVSLAGAGLVTFLPLYALRDGRLTLKELAKRLAEVHHPSHLEGWLARSAGTNKTLGYKRLRHMLVLYRYWVLGLSARYGERLDGRAERLDRAFASYLGLGDDSVKKVRLALFPRFAQS